MGPGRDTDPGATRPIGGGSARRLGSSGPERDAMAIGPRSNPVLRDRSGAAWVRSAGRIGGRTGFVFPGWAGCPWVRSARPLRALPGSFRRGGGWDLGSFRLRRVDDVARAEVRGSESHVEAFASGIPADRGGRRSGRGFPKIPGLSPGSHAKVRPRIAIVFPEPATDDRSCLKPVATACFLEDFVNGQNRRSGRKLLEIPGLAAPKLR